MKYKLATLYFDDDGEGTISLSKDFYDADWVTQADALKDWLYWTEKLYNSLFDHKGFATLSKSRAKEVLK